MKDFFIDVHHSLISALYIWIQLIQEHEIVAKIAFFATQATFLKQFGNACFLSYRKILISDIYSIILLKIFSRDNERT